MVLGDSENFPERGSGVVEEVIDLPSSGFGLDGNGFLLAANDNGENPCQVSLRFLQT